MSDVSPQTGKLLALSMLPGIGPANLRKLAAVEGFSSKSIGQIADEVASLKNALAKGNWSDALSKAEEQAEFAARDDIRILSPLDEIYPALLAATRDDPFLLWVRGSLAPDPLKSVAIIGTRDPTAHGKQITRRITRYFVEQGWSVVSGLASGCDAIAHQEAVDARGHTAAVLAHGLHTVAPSTNRRLAEDIIGAGGALISQYPMGTDAHPHQFVQRDKTQAGLSQGVIMVQSDVSGGSLHASGAILRYGRWLAVPYPTPQDRERNEPKIQANLLLAQGTPEDKARLLQLGEKAGQPNIIVLHSKDDYQKCISKPSGLIARAGAASQSGVI